jgi:hypothetical protein
MVDALRSTTPPSALALRALKRRAPPGEPGDIRQATVEDGCCTLYGIPWAEAPDHLAVDEKQCCIERQPATEAEVRKLITATHVSELGCIPY